MKGISLFLRGLVIYLKVFISVTFWINYKYNQFRKKKKKIILYWVLIYWILSFICYSHIVCSFDLL